MAFGLEINICERCNDFVFKDTTGAVSVDNPDGYGQPALPASPNDFDSYQLLVWPPGTDPEGDPAYTIDLLATPLVIDADGNYPFTVDPSLIGDPTELRSGAWVFQAVADFGGVPYVADLETYFLSDITRKVQNWIGRQDVELGNWDFAYVLMARLKAACLGAQCGLGEAQKLVDWLYRNYKKCC